MKQLQNLGFVGASLGLPYCVLWLLTLTLSIVTATSHGDEAIQRTLSSVLSSDSSLMLHVHLVGWQAHPPGYFTVALFDHHMPICDGLTAARRIRALEAGQGLQETLPIISLTADAQSQAKEDCLNAGMQLYLTKPLRPGAFCFAYPSRYRLFWTLTMFL
jgi:CheY-like chemotaxis protein